MSNDNDLNWCGISTLILNNSSTTGLFMGILNQAMHHIFDELHFNNLNLHRGHKYSCKYILQKRNISKLYNCTK